MGDADGGAPPEKKRLHSSKSRSMSRGRSHSMVEPRPGTGLRDPEMRNKGIKMADKMQWRMNKMAKVCVGGGALGFGVERGSGVRNWGLRHNNNNGTTMGGQDALVNACA